MRRRRATPACLRLTTTGLSSQVRQRLVLVCTQGTPELVTQAGGCQHALDSDRVYAMYPPEECSLRNAEPLRRFRVCHALNGDRAQKRSGNKLPLFRHGVATHSGGMWRSCATFRHHGVISFPNEVRRVRQRPSRRFDWGVDPCRSAANQPKRRALPRWQLSPSCRAPFGRPTRSGRRGTSICLPVFRDERRTRPPTDGRPRCVVRLFPRQRM